MTTPQPAQATPSIPSDGPSTYEQRFTAAVAVICGVTPPAALVCDWINKAERHDDLQQWVGSYAPGWVQNIAVLDAAHQMADQPTEGGDHEPAQQATQAEVTDADIDAATRHIYHNGRPTSKEYRVGIARAILALRPERAPMTERELELIDGMIAVHLDHAQRCDAISNRAMAEKQKGWDMERVELLRRIRSFGITAQVKKESA